LSAGFINLFDGTRDFWTRETGTGQQVDQFLDCYMMMMMMMMMMLMMFDGTASSSENTASNDRMANGK
jgi:hypothetical protein